MKKRLSALGGVCFNPGLCVVAVLFVLSGLALGPRLAAERESKSAGILLDFRDVVTLAAGAGKNVEEAWRELNGAGATGLMVSELTGEQLSLGVLPVYYGPVSGLPGEAAKALNGPLTAPALFFPKGLDRKSVV